MSMAAGGFRVPNMKELTSTAGYRGECGIVRVASQAKALNNIRSATKSIGEGIQVPIEVNLDMAVEYIQVQHPFVHCQANVGFVFQVIKDIRPRPPVVLVQRT